MRKFTWKLEDDYFIIELSEIKKRYGDEGIHQEIKLLVNNILLYHSYWGLEHFLEAFTNPIEDMMFGIQKTNGQITYICKDEPNAVIYKRMSVNESNDFIKWLFYCKLPLVEQRKLKLKQWKEKQLG